MKCHICKNQITRYISKKEKQRNKHFFCSRKCFVIHWANERRGKKNVNWKGGKLKKYCKQCRKRFEHKRSEKGIFCSKKCQCKFNLSGEKHWRWKGGISKERDKIKHTWRYIKWRQRVYKRDNWICRMCGIHCKKGNIHAHHIYKFSDYPRLRFKMNNGITLCKQCHKKTYGKEEKFAMAFKEILRDYTPDIPKG